MMPTVKFFSRDRGSEVEAEVLEIRKHTMKLRLLSGKVIVKKRKQLL